MVASAAASPSCARCGDGGGVQAPPRWRVRGRGPGRGPTGRSRCSRCGRSNTRARATRRRGFRAAGCGPIRPRWRSGPISTCPPTTTPTAGAGADDDPEDDPRAVIVAASVVTRNDLAPAPSTASDRAKQLASLATRTGRPSRCARSRSSGCPISQVLLAFFTRPVAGDSVPGMPMPTVPVRPEACSSRAPVRRWRPTWRGSRAGSRRGNGPARGLRSAFTVAFVESNALDLGAAQVDADAHRARLTRPGRAHVRVKVGRCILHVRTGSRDCAG